MNCYSMTGCIEYTKGQPSGSENSGNGLFTTELYMTFTF